MVDSTKYNLEVELKEIRSLLLKLNKKVEGLTDLLEERLISLEEPTPEDVAAIKDYESAKKKGKLTLVPLAIWTKGNARKNFLDDKKVPRRLQ